MTEIRHIVFDIGKVLVHYDPNLPFSRLIPDEKERKWFFDNVCTHDWNIEQDRGRTWEEAEALAIADHPDHAENIRNFRRHWHEMAPHAYDDSVAIMEKLIDSGHDVTLLTNWAADTFIEARGRSIPGPPTRHHRVRRDRADQAGSQDLRPSRRFIRPRSGRVPVHRRQPEECRRRQGGRLAGGVVHGCQDTSSGS